MTSVSEPACELKRALEALREFADDGMCGRCLPCPLATRQAIGILERIVAGRGETADLARLSRVATELVDAARCPRGEETARKLGESLESAEEYARHIDGICPSGSCRALVRYRVIPERCTMCGQCVEACPRDAIEGDPYVPYLGDNRPYEIRRTRCDGCGLCVQACPADAIEQVV